MKCGRCHAELPGKLAGNCPACLIADALLEPPEAGVAEEAHSPGEINGYEILKQIGRGGSGIVYLAYHRNLKRLAALKVLHAGLVGSFEGFERFRVEAAAVARLDHPNIVPLYEAGARGQTHYLILRYYEHGSLADALKRRPAPFSALEGARIILAASQAIQYAHSRGVLHRDLKPSNLLMDQEGRVSIADFGLAKITGEDHGLTLSSSVLGTPNYMAPEQADGRARDSTVAADIYSLGAILYEVLTGRPPFEGETVLSVLRKVADDDPPRPRTINPSIDRDLEAICLCCLEKAPERRYASAGALASDLQRRLDGKPVAARTPTVAERGVKWVRRRPVLAGLWAAFLVTLAAGMAGTLWQWRVARRTAEAARLESYFTAMDLVERTWRHNPSAARRILDRYRPAKGERDIRGWEWRYFWAALRGDQPDRRTALPGAGRLYSLALSENEKLLAVGQTEGGVRILDAESLKLIYQSPGTPNSTPAPLVPSGNVVGAKVVFIRGTGLFAWSENYGITNSTIKFWNCERREVVRELPQEYIVRNLAVPAHGGRLIVEYQSPVSKTAVWDLATWTVIAETKSGPKTSNYAYTHPLAASPDGRRLAIEEFPRRARVFDVETKTDQRSFPLTDPFLLAAAFSPDGKRLAVSAGFGSEGVQLWNVESGTLEESLPSMGWFSRLAFTADGKTLAGTSGQNFILWNLPERKVTRAISHRFARLADFVLTRDGTRTYAGDDRGGINSWNINASSIGLPEKKIETTFEGHVRFIPGSERLIGASSEQLITELGLDGESAQRGAPATVISVDVLPGSAAYISGFADGSITLRDKLNHQERQKFSGMKEAPHTIRAFSKSKRVLAMGKQQTKVWDLETGEWLFDLPGPGSDGWAEAAPDEMIWTILSFDGGVLRANLLNGETNAFQLPFSKATVFAYSPDGKYVVTTGVHCPARLYTSNWRHLRNLPETEENGGTAVAFSADGERVALGYGGVARLIDVRSGRTVCTLRSALDMAFTLAFSSNGNALAMTGRVNRQVYLWRAPSWDEISRMESAPGF